MRLILTLCITIALCAAADAAPRKPRPVTGPGQAAPSGDITPSGARVFRDNSAPGGWRTDHDDPPSPNDPSRRGSG